jgi:cytoskeletal protein CcmA (bactofilin family)
MFKSKSSDEPAQSATTIIGAGTTITGNVVANGDIRIDGILKGNLHGKAKILIGPEGKVEGDIVGVQGDILGRVLGSIKISDLLHLKGKSNIDGDIFAAKLQIEPTASFNGQCHMGANVVDLAKDKFKAVVNE